VQIVADRAGVMVRFANGRAACWGYSGVCPTEEAAYHPVLANGIKCSTWVSVSDAGGASVRDDGAVLVWGANPVLKQEDYETQSPPWEPVQVSGLPPMRFALDANGGMWTVDRDGQAWFWGHIYPWGLNQDVPAAAPQLGTWQSLSGGGAVCGLQEDSTVSCFGANAYGQLGDGTLVERPEPVKVAVPPALEHWSDGTASCVATLEGELWCWGYPATLPRGEEVEPLEGATPMPTPMPPVRSGALGDRSGCAITWDDDLYCWGGNPAIPRNGEVWVPTHIPAAGKVEQVAIGDYYICAIRTDGTVWCGGNVSYGRPDLDDPNRWDIVDFSQLTAGSPQ
jgi:hypothetical protein